MEVVQGQILRQCRSLSEQLGQTGCNSWDNCNETNQPTYDGIVISIKSSPGFRSMKSTMLSPSLTAPKSSTTRAESRVLHVLTSSLLK